MQKTPLFRPLTDCEIPLLPKIKNKKKHRKHTHTPSFQIPASNQYPHTPVQQKKTANRAHRRTQCPRAQSSVRAGVYGGPGNFEYFSVQFGALAASARARAHTGAHSSHITLGKPCIKCTPGAISPGTRSLSRDNGFLGGLDPPPRARATLYKALLASSARAEIRQIAPAR